MIAEKLESAISDLGYRFVRVKPKLSKKSIDLSVDVEFYLERADRLFIERIDISGNTATLDRVVRRQFFIAEGDPFNPREINAASKRIRELGIFSDTSVNVLQGSSKSEVIIDEVTEMPTGSLTLEPVIRCSRS